MSRPGRQPPAPEDLPQLFLGLLRRLEKVEGALQQLVAEGNRDALRPTWKDIQQVRADITALRQKIQGL